MLSIYYATINNTQALNGLPIYPIREKARMLINKRNQFRELYHSRNG